MDSSQARHIGGNPAAQLTVDGPEWDTISPSFIYISLFVLLGYHLHSHKCGRHSIPSMIPYVLNQLSGIVAGLSSPEHVQDDVGVQEQTWSIRRCRRLSHLSLETRSELRRVGRCASGFEGKRVAFSTPGSGFGGVLILVVAVPDGFLELRANIGDLHCSTTIIHNWSSRCNS